MSPVAVRHRRLVAAARHPRCSRRSRSGRLRGRGAPRRRGRRRKCRDHLVAEVRDEGVEIQLPGQRLADPVDDLELGGLAPGLVEQPRVLERDAEARRETWSGGRTSASLKASSRSRFWSEIDADRRRAASPAVRSMVDFGCSPWMTSGLAGSQRHASRWSGRFMRSGSRSSMTCPRKPAMRSGSSGKRTPRSIVYGKWNEPVVAVDDPDVDDLRVEDLLDLVADEVVHRLHVELGGEARPGRC